MALLLAMYQKMRMIREYNSETLKLTRYSSKVDRIARNIKNVQKMYEGRLKRVQQQAQRMQSQASIFFQNMAGLGSNSMNLNPYSFNGLSQFVVNAAGSILEQGMKGKDGSLISITGDEYQEMMQAYARYGNEFYYQRDENGQVLKDDDGNALRVDSWSEDKVTAFLNAVQQARWGQSTMQSQVAERTQQYQNMVSIWLEAEEAQIEAEQDAALEPLEYEQTMMELDKEASEERCQRLKAEMESYDQLLSEEAKNSAPSFGLR